MGRRKQVTVIGSSVACEEEKQAALATGRIIAELDAVLITGGRGGVMEAAGRGAHDAGGLVVGLLPDTEFSAANQWCDVVIPSGIGLARNLPNVLAGDAVVIVGGGSGTLSEPAYAWQFGRPLIALNWLPGWSRELAGRSLDQRRADTVTAVSSLEELAEVLKKIVAL